MGGTAKPMTEPAVERRIGERFKAAKIRLRADRVVQALSTKLKTELGPLLAVGECCLITVTAPIKVAAKTAATLVSQAREGSLGDEFKGRVHGNHVCVRRLKVGKRMPKVLLFVHNPDLAADVVLDIAMSQLRGAD